MNRPIITSQEKAIELIKMSLPRPYSILYIEFYEKSKMSFDWNGYRLYFDLNECKIISNPWKDNIKVCDFHLLLTTLIRRNIYLIL